MKSFAFVMALGAAVMFGGTANANPAQADALTAWQTTEFSSQHRRGHGHRAQRVVRPHHGARQGHRRVHGGGHGAVGPSISIGVGGGGHGGRHR